jgi:hypothetical protein
MYFTKRKYRNDNLSLSVELKISNNRTASTKVLISTFKAGILRNQDFEQQNRLYQSLDKY